MTPFPSTLPSTRALRRPLAVLVAVLMLLPTAGAHGASAEGGTASRGWVDGNLLAQLAEGAAPAILTWDDGKAGRDDVLAHLDASGLDYQVFPHLDMAVACVADRAGVEMLATAPGAQSVWADEDLTPVLDMAGVQAGLDGLADDGVAAPMAADVTETGEGVGIVVLDTGIDATHRDLTLGTKTVANTRVIVSHYEILGVGEDTCAPDTYQEDLQDSENESGHGTAIAGIAAGSGASDSRYAGVAPGADLVGINVLGQANPQYQGDVKVSTIRFIAGVSHALSTTLLNGPTTGKVALIGWSRNDLYDPFHPHYLAIRDLWDFGMTPVVPVGNDGARGISNCSAIETCAFNPFGAGDSVVAVAALDANGRRAEFSSLGDPETRTSRGRLIRYQPTLSARGVNVMAPLRAGVAQAGTPSDLTLYQPEGAGSRSPAASATHQPMSGTSIAAAQVAGAIALMQDAALGVYGCFLDPYLVRVILEGSATPIAGHQIHEVGAGALNIEAAVEWAGDRERAFYGGPNPWDCAPR